VVVRFFFFKQKTAYEIVRCWSSDVCSSDLVHPAHAAADRVLDGERLGQHAVGDAALIAQALESREIRVRDQRARIIDAREDAGRSEERRVGKEGGAGWAACALTKEGRRHDG